MSQEHKGLWSWMRGKSWSILQLVQIRSVKHVNFRFLSFVANLVCAFTFLFQENLTFHYLSQERFIKANVWDSNLDLVLVVVYWQAVPGTKFILESKSPLTRIQKVACVLEYMKSYQIWMEKALQEILAFIELIEDRWRWEGLMKVETYVSLLFADFFATDIIWC